MPHTNIFDKIASYEFKDSIGHPLENCAEYIALRARITQLEAVLIRLRESKPGGTYFQKWEVEIDKVLQSPRHGRNCDE